MSRIICLNGPVGSGKTTLLKRLNKYLPNCYVIREYIDVLPDAKDKLQQYLDGTYSAFSFQEYILDYFESVAKELKDSSYDYILCERTPIEGIIFFAKLDLLNHRMNKAEYDYLINRAKSLKFYPNPLDDDALTINTDRMSPYKISQYVLSKLHTNSFRIIKLRASLPIIRERILMT